MSFFGQSNNQQSSGGFGGFGSNNTSGTGFGQSSNTGFGASTGSGLFGANNTSSTNTGFGGTYNTRLQACFRFRNTPYIPSHFVSICGSLHNALKDGRFSGTYYTKF
ncbi:MAG: hypothetical protein Q9204_003650 [Flavoplaca sp. TL-2023a]